ncbi:CopG family antitoxin [Bartonella sp. DGB1]|uniref:CopG family antitoxin n=1 Tax=Bartonella sp. DGB1 TaxID=3239807 RepID=UPI003525B87B
MTKKNYNKPNNFNNFDEQRIVVRETLLERDLVKIHTENISPKPKNVSLSLSLPKSLLKIIKSKAKIKGISYTCYVRQILEKNLQGDLN